MKHFLNTQDWSFEALDGLLKLATELKADPLNGRLAGKSIALLFMNPSMRTRTSFQLGMQQLGGIAIVLEPGKDAWGVEFNPGVVMDGEAEEHIAEVAGVLSRYVDLIGIRAFPKFVDWSLDRQADVRTRTGLPAPLVHLEVVDVMGDPLPHDGKSIGEVVVRAPWLTQGYVGDPEESEKLWRDGWLHTGDIGYIDEEEYLRLTDRTEDAIKTGGEWIPSMELEDIICEHEAVGEAAVTRVPDEKYGEKPLALVVLKPGFEGKVDEETIRRFCQEYVRKGALPKHGVPERIALVDAIPRTSVGKVSRRQLRQQNKPFDLNREPGSPD